MGQGCATLHVMPDLSELPKAGGKAPMRSQSGGWLLQVHGLPERLGGWESGGRRAFALLM